MSSSSEVETDISDSELEDYSETCYQQLKDGKFEVNISVGVYRCPYCTHRKWRQQYGLKDLLQHASAVVEGSGFKGGAKEKAKHIGLLKYLESIGPGVLKFLESIGPSKPSGRNSREVLNNLQTSDSNELLVYPWVGIVANVPVTLEEGMNVGESDEKLRSEFTAKGFNPTKVTPFWNFRSHLCFAVVEFGQGWPGYHYAMKFEKCFEASGKGKQDFFEAKHLGTDLYGWIGRKDDYCSEKAFGDFLREFKYLKTVNDIEAKEKSKSNKLLLNLSNVIEEENMHLEEIKVKYTETSISLNNLIAEKDKLFQAYSEENQKMQQNTNVQLQNIVKEHQKMKVELEQHEKDLQKREPRNVHEKRILDHERDMIERAILEQKEEYDKVFKLTEYHKEKNKELEQRNMDLEKQVIAKQKALKWQEEPYKYETLQTLGDKERKTNEELHDARRELSHFFK